ncbi:MAG: fatty acid desaturase family protein [Pseudomonadota bacterium]
MNHQAVADLVGAQRLAAIERPSNWRGLWCVLCQYGLLAGAFVIAAIWPNPLTITLGVLVIGSRQLGFFILSHECGHRSLFANKRWNEFFATWLLAPWDFANNRAYMREHLTHHRSAGQADDPDLTNYVDYPIPKARLRRKLLRDITGQTGWRNLRFNLEGLFRLGQQTPEQRAALLRGAGANGLLLSILTASGHAWLYLMWIAGLLFVQPLVARIRQIAEHAAVEDLRHPDPRKHTRTLYANPLERLFICPHQVNYHVEHHLLASVPIYRLRALHAALREQGYFDGVLQMRGYGPLLRHVTTV